MATVTRQDGTKITINDAITKTSFSSISAGTVVTQAYLDSLTTAITKLEGYAAKVDNCGYTNCCESCQDSCTCQSSGNQSCQNTCTCQSDKNQGCQNTCTNCTNGNQGCQNSCTNQSCQNSCTNQGCQSSKNQGCQSSTNQSCQS